MPKPDPLSGWLTPGHNPSTATAFRRFPPMPIRWYGPADPADPLYRHYARIVNLVLHAMVFGAVNSGLWFVEGMRHPWPHLAWLTEGWGALVGIQLLMVVLRRPRQDAPS
ncbi:MAG: hypothetical protein RLZZ124_181 [Cyanobacteriota bacterium]